jgi:hypothetical protein
MLRLGLFYKNQFYLASVQYVSAVPFSLQLQILGHLPVTYLSDR